MNCELRAFCYVRCIREERGLTQSEPTRRHLELTREAIWDACNCNRSVLPIPWIPGYVRRSFMLNGYLHEVVMTSEMRRSGR
jgi:hypothetical protein